jgi:hypothetical protein
LLALARVMRDKYFEKGVCHLDKRLFVIALESGKRGANLSAAIS